MLSCFQEFLKLTKDLFIPLFLIVLTAFGGYVLNDLDSGIKAINAKTDKISLELEYHGHSILTLRNFLGIRALPGGHARSKR